MSGAYLHRFAWTRIVRHQVVKGAASPDDPALTEYWAQRRRKTTPLPIDKTSLWLNDAQDGRCPLCKHTLFAADDRPQNPHEWERWLATTRKTLTKIAMREPGTPDKAEPRLIHAECRHRHHAAHGTGSALLPAYKPEGLA
jgi:RNA-directed DNA polymerase